ncbi:VCBS repeat-containing protein [Kriegella aquimaris]|uniref:Repeat domain-containing protein n=1 Tax=Kriegella aquimaris TaxID=192904 RepID=A0A1G9S2G7_9FLAO|nr:VCBS repeat-containing protein [Kriegella aquimaris]SDM29683.1 Repeat domain-containing protein [Kriegella aquimaris]
MNYHQKSHVQKLVPSLLTSLLFLVFSCKDSNKHDTKDPAPTGETKLFTTVPSQESGIDFINTLEETLESNYYQYMYTYIGGGIAAGDLNNDGLLDLYFTSNSSQDKIYLNKGDFKFEDITSKTGISQNEGFNTGVTMVDINNDGNLDIYVSRGGWQDEDNKFANLLYINNGDLTFSEQAKEVGLADSNRTIQATFFDYDKDNDLDVYVSNTPDITSRSEVLDLEKIQRDPKTLELKGSDRLYQNDGTGHFTDVSEKAGLQFDIGFGLNPQVGDLNNDGWPDVYVCNDFNVPDLAYINNGNGTFTESRDKLFKHMSFNSMGSDMADIDNDGLLDLMTLDMNPEDYIRSKTTMAMTSIPQFELMVEKGYHHQYMHNMLQMNNGNGTFSEIGKMAGMADTDWSWALLSADFDLDGLNDIFVTNGVYRDVIDRDKNNEILEILKANQRKPTKEDFLKFAQMLPQQKLNNYFFKNKGDKTFEDTSTKWSDSVPTFSNGAVYADLDNDGDLDVVVNNINDHATVLKNTASDIGLGDYLKLQFSGPQKNRAGLGVTANIYLEDGSLLTRQLINTRGFLSAVSNTLSFGIGKDVSVKKMEILWPDGKQEEFINVPSNQLLTVAYTNATDPKKVSENSGNTLFAKVKTNFSHIDPYFNDYDLQILLPHKLSQLGPAIAKGDANGDGIEDIYLGGGHTQPGQILLGQKEGGFKETSTTAFNEDAQSEDIGAAFFDFDNDGDQDLYVVSGSYEFYENPRLLIDRLYLNNGQGVFSKSRGVIPEVGIAGSIVVPSDYDGDGDIDLFVGGRVITGKYPHPASSLLLLNEGGKFTIQNENRAPELNNIGLVTDAVWTDINTDGKIDLVITGEWMGVQIFLNENNMLKRSDNYPNLAAAVGWWNRLLIDDIDNDGDKDIIAGNLGLNYKFHTSYEKPFEIYTSDFDFNGSEDVILAKKYGDRQVPVRGKSCMTQQLPQLAQKIPTYSDFASKDLKGIVGDGLESALHYKVTEFRSGIFLNQGKEGFDFQPLPVQVQQSPINSIVYEDFDGDGSKDLVLAGNNYQSEVETTRADAGIGVFLKGNGKGGFTFIPALKSGLFVDKDVRNMLVITDLRDKLLFVVNNNDKHDLFKVIKPKN